jgi:2-C-methyl-D-erythritol 4-phosphate cytidylyltransferase
VIVSPELGPSETSGPAAGGGGEGVALIVPAGGSGSRLGSVRKQFRELAGEPVIVRTLHRFDRHEGIDAIYLAAPADRAGDLGEELERFGLRKIAAVVPGGATRQKSVAAALAAIPGALGIVLVHDAVRPFVSAEEISAVISAVRRFGAAATAIPVADTLRRVDGGLFGATVARDQLYRMQTPQGFRIDWLREALAEAEKAGLDLTDDVALVQRMGRRVHLVEGNPRNFKITTPADWALAIELSKPDEPSCE